MYISREVSQKIKSAVQRYLSSAKALIRSWQKINLPGEPSIESWSIWELTPMALSLLLMLPTLPLRVAACIMPLPAWLSTELFRGKSFERPLYLLLGNRSVRENRFLLILIVLSKFC